MRSPTPRARSTESGRTGPANEKPTRREKATAAAGAMCVIDWNSTCAKPMECSCRWSNLCPESISTLPDKRPSYETEEYIPAMFGARRSQGVVTEPRASPDILDGLVSEEPPRPDLTVNLEAFDHHLPLGFVLLEGPEDRFHFGFVL